MFDAAIQKELNAWHTAYIEREKRLPSTADTFFAAYLLGKNVKQDDSMDKPDRWTPLIEQAHPTVTGLHMPYELALAMVSNRHSKGALIDLVNWLLLLNMTAINELMVRGQGGH